MRWVLLVVALVSACFLAASPAAAQGYPLMCHSGSGMSARVSVGNGYSLTIDFKRASHGFSEQEPPHGTCAWNDRPTNSAEPTRLHFSDPGLAALVGRELKRGGFFTVTASTQGDLLEVSGVDSAAGGNGDGDQAGQMPSEAAQMPSEAGQMPSNEPGQATTGTDFSGQWDSLTEDGNEFTIELTQSGKIVKGTYDGMDNDVRGTIKGVIKSGALHFSWAQGRFRGSGVFTLSDDGSSFEGSFTAEGQSSEKAWSGNRL